MSKYICPNCKTENAIIEEIFITKTLKFRVKYYCLNCNIDYQVTVNGRNWKHFKYDSSEVRAKIDNYINKLQLERYFLDREQFKGEVSGRI